MQGFSGKILPAGLEIFSENRRLDLAFPFNPGITFAPRTKMTAWCGSLKDAKMEVNGSGGRLDRKTSKEKSVKKGKRQKEKGHCRRRETGQTTGKEVWFYMSGRACTVGRIKSFFPVCLPCVTACSIYGSGGQTRLSAYGSKEQWKKKNRQKPVKAPLWHKHKRNGPCIISLNCCLGVRQSPFLRLCVVGIRSTKILLGDGVPTDKTAFTEKLVWEEKIREIHFKISRFIVTFAYEEFFEGYATRRRMMQ